MITNRPALFTLQFLSRATEGWTLLHGICRWIYLRAFTPLFEVYLKRIIPADFELIARHSVISRTAFNVFRSDLDYSIIFASEPEAACVQIVLERCDGLRRILPFLGELEFYTQVEWQQKHRLEGEHAALFDLIRAFRKFDWEFKKLNGAKDPYHRRKAEAALMRIAGLPAGRFRLQDCKIAMQVQMSGYLHRIPTHVPLYEKIESHSYFLGWSFGTDHNENDELRIRLTASECIALAGLLPEGAVTPAECEQAIHALRELPTLRRAYLAICRTELLLCQSVRRSNRHEDAVLKNWITTLEREIARAGVSSPSADLTILRAEL